MDEHIIRNRRRSWLLVGAALLLLFCVGAAVNFWMGGGPLGVLVAAGIAIAGTWGSYFFSDRIALTIAGARQVTQAEAPVLVNVVEEMTIASGLPMPKVCIVDDPAPNAFATGRDPEHAVVAVTTGLLERLNRDELQGVIAHEMSHVLNRDTLVGTLVVTICGTIVILCDLFWRFGLFGGGSRRRGSDRSGPGAVLLVAVGALVVVLAPLAAALIKAAVSRHREHLADFSAVSLSRNPAGLRAALEKLRADSTVVRHTSHAMAHLWIESPLDRQAAHGGWLNRLFDTHPSLDERIAALRELEGQAATSGPDAPVSGAWGPGTAPR